MFISECLVGGGAGKVILSSWEPVDLVFSIMKGVTVVVVVKRLLVIVIVIVIK
mgnify:CR=1 FL=1